MSVQLTATIEIKQTEHEPEVTDRYSNTTPGFTRTTDVASFVVRADTVEALVAKTRGHLALLEVEA